FISTVTKCYFVDKSLLIKGLIDDFNLNCYPAKLFTRPRRFGKSLNLSMVKTFFEKTDEDTSVYFKDLKIWQCGEKYTSEQGKYPVIFLDFKNAEGDCWESLYGDLKKVIANEYIRHNKELSDFIDEDRVDTYNRIKKETGTDADYKDSLRLLTELLCKKYGKKVIVLLDEYDDPVQKGSDRGYYQKVIDFIKPFLSAALKGNGVFLQMGIMTGVTRVFKEGTYSGLNSVDVYSVLNDKFVEYFGLTKNEVHEYLDYFGHADREKEVIDWYDGYLFGTNTEMFNPWSVSHYLYNNCKAQAYWVNTSSNPIIKEVLSISSEKVAENLATLINGGTISAIVSDNVAYNEVRNEENVYSVLVEAGYLTFTVDDDGNRFLKIPNSEVKDVFKSEILNYLWSGGNDTAYNIKKALVAGNMAEFNRLLSNFMMVSSNCYDTSAEKSYQNIMVGLTAAFDDIYMVHSNHTAGYGRSDIELIPRSPEKNYPGVIFEFEKCDKESKMRRMARAGLRQIDRMRYDAQLLDAGVREIYKYGVAFCGQKVLVVR
ncbi:MAG: ATP-binding protein, partial [Clostridia bacterium]|nr:ATP-binding protein [Clostridia bacterium]